MGYFKEISTSSEYSARNVADYNRMNGWSGHTAAGVVLSQNLPSVFMALTGKLVENKIAKENNKSENTSENSERTRLEEELKKALNDIGAKDENNINEAVTEKQNQYEQEIQTAQEAVNKFTNNQDEYSLQIATLSTQLAGLNEQNDPNGIQRGQIKAQIEELKTKQQNALKLAQENLQSIKKTAEAELNKITTRASEALKILQQLADLNKVGDDIVTVHESTEALHYFSNARTAFQKALNDNNDVEAKSQAKKLKELYEANPNNETIRKAYENLLKTKVEKVLK